jgi:hypothetical protein
VFVRAAQRPFSLVFAPSAWPAPRRFAARCSACGLLASPQHLAASLTALSRSHHGADSGASPSARAACIVRRSVSANRISNPVLENDQDKATHS